MRSTVPCAGELTAHGPAISIAPVERSWSLDRREALNRFFTGVERRAFRMAEMATKDPDEALDLVQDAMLKLVQHYGARDEAEWPPLFHRILQHKIRDWYRRTTVRNRWRLWLGRWDEDQEGDALEAVPDSSTPAADEVVSQKGATVALERALRELPLRQQQAFLLRLWEEYDVAQTARIMGCSQGSVKTHLSRAVHTLRQRLKDHR